MTDKEKLDLEAQNRILHDIIRDQEETNQGINAVLGMVKKKLFICELGHAVKFTKEQAAEISAILSDVQKPLAVYHEEICKECAILADDCRCGCSRSTVIDGIIIVLSKEK